MVVTTVLLVACGVLAAGDETSTEESSLADVESIPLARMNQIFWMA